MYEFQYTKANDVGQAVGVSGRCGNTVIPPFVAGPHSVLWEADGSVHDDVTALDVIVCATLIALPLPHGPDWSVTAQRHIALFIRGLRTDG